MSDIKRDTSKNMIQITPCVSDLHPSYISEELRQKAAYMSKLDQLDKIEKNFNIDQYGGKYSNIAVQKILQKHVSKEDLKLSKNFKVEILDEIRRKQQDKLSHKKRSKARRNSQTTLN